MLPGRNAFVPAGFVLAHVQWLIFLPNKRGEQVYQPVYLINQTKISVVQVILCITETDSQVVSLRQLYVIISLFQTYR